MIAGLVYTRNKLPRHKLAVALPVLPVLSTATLKIAGTPMNQHNKEKHRVKVRDRRGETGAQAPGEGLDPIRHVILPTTALSAFVGLKHGQ
jgi:hypothetical protein